MLCWSLFEVLLRFTQTSTYQNPACTDSCKRGLCLVQVIEDSTTKHKLRLGVSYIYFSYSQTSLQALSKRYKSKEWCRGKKLLYVTRTIKSKKSVAATKNTLGSTLNKMSNLNKLLSHRWRSENKEQKYSNPRFNWNIRILTNCAKFGNNFRARFQAPHSAIQRFNRCRSTAHATFSRMVKWHRTCFILIFIFCEKLHHGIVSLLLPQVSVVFAFPEWQFYLQPEGNTKQTNQDK